MYHPANPNLLVHHHCMPCGNTPGGRQLLCVTWHAFSMPDLVGSTQLTTLSADHVVFLDLEGANLLGNLWSA